MSYTVIPTRTTADANSAADINQLMANLTAQCGMVMIWPLSASIPTGWMECNGDAINRTTYSTLFALISTTYGVGDGSTTFNLPDTENDGSFIRHYKSGVSAAIATLQADAFQGHWTTIPAYINASGFGAGYPARCNNAGGAQADYSADSTIISDGVHGTPRTASETRPVNYAMKYIIKVL